jgi:hypothetical protein
VSNGKTDKPRPFSVTKEEYEANHARTFGDPREVMRQANLQDAADTILNAPPASWMPTPTQDTK